MTSNTPTRVASAVLMAVALALSLAGCGATAPTVFVPDGSPTTLAKVGALAAKTDLSRVASVDVSQAADARVDALVWLRGQGDDGDRVATLLTQGFPERTAAVPVKVEIAVVDGTRSAIVVEAYGDASGPLTHRRLWVFDLATGDVTLSASYR